MAAVSLADATKEVARRDRVLARAIARLGPLEELGERFRPYRSIVARYCWAALGNPVTTYTSLSEKETTRSGRPKKTARAEQ